LAAKITFDISFGLASDEGAGRGRKQTPGDKRITQGTMGKGVMIPFQDIIKLEQSAGTFRYSEADGIRTRVIVPEVNATPARIAEMTQGNEVGGFRFEGCVRIGMAQSSPGVAQG
jgi:hypothetical protein